MADSEYATIIGNIAFDPTEREVGDDNVIDLPIRDVVSGEIIRTTVWPGPLQDFDYQKDQLVAVDGKLKKREVKGRTYFNMDARTIHVLNTTTLTVNGSEKNDPPKRRGASSRAY